jgi:hypothetical protein
VVGCAQLLLTINRFFYQASSMTPGVQVAATTDATPTKKCMGGLQMLDLLMPLLREVNE